MATERDKYVSSTFKTAGLGLAAPVSTILFQWLVFEKSSFFGHFIHSCLVLIVGIILLYIGYRILPKEKNK